MKWPMPVWPLLDELATSWILRCAAAHGEIPHSFTTATWGRRQVWNRDADRSLTSADLAILASQMGIDGQAARNTNLDSLVELIGGWPRESPARSVIPGLMVAGIYHRKRRRHGLQFCPECLMTDREPYFRRRWRLAVSIVCTRHGCELADACPACDSPVMPHRASRYSMLACTVCGSSLAFNGELATKAATGAQALIDELVGAEKAVVGKKQVSVESWIAGVRILYSALHSARVARAFGRRPDAKAWAPLEFARVCDRIRGLPIVTSMLRQWPREFIERCESGNVRRLDIADARRKPPDWLLEVLEVELPHDRIRRRAKAKKRRRCRDRRSIAEIRREIDLGAYMSDTIERAFEVTGDERLQR